MKIYDGKYEFYEDERGTLMCKRHGEPWREFVGDKAVHGLFSHARDLEEKVEKLKAENVALAKGAAATVIQAREYCTSTRKAAIEECIASVEQMGDRSGYVRVGKYAAERLRALLATEAKS